MTTEREPRETIITGDKLLLGLQYLNFLTDYYFHKPAGRPAFLGRAPFRRDGRVEEMLTLELLENHKNCYALNQWTLVPQERKILERHMRSIELAQFRLEAIVHHAYSDFGGKRLLPESDVLLCFFRALACGEITEQDLRKT